VSPEASNFGGHRANPDISFAEKLLVACRVEAPIDECTFRLGAEL